MPDISMCRNTECNKRGTCYRYRVVPKESMQSYMAPNHLACKHYATIDGADKLRPLDVIDKENREVDMN